MNIKPLNVLGAEVSNVDLKALSGKVLFKRFKMQLINTGSFFSGSSLGGND